MALAFSSALDATLAATPDQKAWATALKTALGSTPRVRCFRDANAAAVDPVATGVEFLNAGTVGGVTVVGAKITSFGTLTNVTTKLAADLATGKSVLRIEGNGNWVQGSVGLTGTDFLFTANPTGAASLGIAADLRMSPPALLASGTGFAPPPDPVYTIDIVDWSSGAAGAVQTLTPNVRMKNWVYDHPHMAATSGDCRVHRCAQSVVLGEIEFGALVWGMHPSANAQTSDPVYEILVIQKPTSTNWPGYPASAGYQVGTSNTFAPAHKIVIRKNGVAVKTIEMRDALPMNSPQLNMDGAQIATKPIRPWMCTAQVYYYRSARPKLNPSAAQLHSGYESDVLRPTTAREKSSTNPIYPLYAFRDQLDSVNQWYALNKWALPADATTITTVPNGDAFLYGVTTESAGYGSLGYGLVYLTGYGYEPGANGGHDWHSGPGGSRHDRAMVAHPFAAYLANSSYVRPKGSEPILDLVDDWSMNYCNIPHHVYANVVTGATIPVDEVFGAKGSANYWTQGGNTWYGSLESYVEAGKSKTVNFFGIGNGAGQVVGAPYRGSYIDKNNRLPFHGALNDQEHCYKSPFMAAAYFNSPAMAHLTKHSAINTILAQLGDVAPDKHPGGWFLLRTTAWRYKPYVENWYLSTDHELGISRTLIEDRFQKELEKLHDTIRKDVVVDNLQTPYAKAMRNLGVPIRWQSDNQWHQASQSLTFYIAGVFHLMKTTGLWDVMVAKSSKCRDALYFMIDCLDLYAIDWILDTDGRNDYYADVIKTGRSDLTAAEPFANWAEYAALREPPNGQSNWIKNPDGSRKNESDGSQHLRYQYLTLRKYYITQAEVPCKRANGIDLALAKYRDFYQQRADSITTLAAGGASNDTLRRADWYVRWAGYAGLKPPVV